MKFVRGKVDLILDIRVAHLNEMSGVGGRGMGGTKC